MKTIILVFIASFGFVCLSCENEAVTKNMEVVSVEATPIKTSSKEQTKNAQQKPSQTEDGQKTGKDFYDEALKLRSDGKLEESAEKFTQAAESGFNEIESYREAAKVYLVLKRYNDAEKYFLKILEKNPKDDTAHWALARLYIFDMKKYQEGLREAQIIKEMDKTSYSYIWKDWIGRGYDGLGDYENAIKHYKIFLKGNSDMPDSYDYKDTKARITELEKALKDKKTVVPERSPTPKNIFAHPW